MFARVAAQMVPGRALEIGGGSGMSRNFLPEVLVTDIVPTPWVDLVADCQLMPFRSGCFRNIILLDVLHHVARISAFLAEAARVLAPGGRLIMVEPAMTAVSQPLFRAFHEEPVDMAADPFADRSGSEDPFEANQAIPTLLFGKYRNRLEHEFSQFHIKTVQYFSLWAYPLSGGFQSWSLLPYLLVGPVLRAEHFLEHLIGHVVGFRLFVVLERSEEN